MFAGWPAPGTPLRRLRPGGWRLPQLPEWPRSCRRHRPTPAPKAVAPLRPSERPRPCSGVGAPRSNPLAPACCPLQPFNQWDATSSRHLLRQKVGLVEAPRPQPSRVQRDGGERLQGWQLRPTDCVHQVACKHPSQLRTRPVLERVYGVLPGAPEPPGHNERHLSDAMHRHWLHDRGAGGTPERTRLPAPRTARREDQIEDEGDDSTTSRSPGVIRWREAALAGSSATRSAFQTRGTSPSQGRSRL